MAVSDLTIAQGKTLTRVLHWGGKPFIYKPITAITRGAPARLTVTAHGVVDGWEVAVVSVDGMDQINARHDPPRLSEFHIATVVDADTIELNDVNSADFDAYTSGGYLQLYTPVSLAQLAARLTIRDQVGGSVILALTSSPPAGIVLDDTAKTITFTITATQSAALALNGGVYELEVQTSGGVVSQLLYGDFIVDPPEIAT